MNAREAFRKGWLRSGFYWQALIPLFLVNLLSGLLMAALPSLELLGPAHYTSIRDAASGVPTWMASEILFSPINTAEQAGTSVNQSLPSDISTGILALLIALGLLPFLSWIPGSLMNGGVLATYWGWPDPFRWRKFLQGCWHYWGAFLLFGLLQTLLTLLLIIPLLGVFSIAAALFSWSAILLAPLFLFLLILWTAFTEVTQVYLVAGGKRKIGEALREALSLLRHQLISLASYYIVSLLLLLGLHVIFRGGIFPRMPLATWPLVLVLQQSFIVLRLWAHASRLAGDTEYVRGQGVKSAELAELQTSGEAPFGEGLQPLD
jgi:hypothetical protein